MSDTFELLLKPSKEKSAHIEPIKMQDRSGKYRVGAPMRPQIPHDNGHLDKFPKREPTVSDRAAFLKWNAKLELSEQLCTRTTGKHVPLCDGALEDANAAYRHFLHGNGADRRIDYEKFLREDPSASMLVVHLIEDFQTHVEIIGRNRLRFSVTSDYYTVGRNGVAPYPSSANWQKTIGAHFLWVSADVSVSAHSSDRILYYANLTIHVEDRYNFNPGASDVATGIPDSENGAFEIAGLGHQYTNFAEVKREFQWIAGDHASLQLMPSPINHKHDNSTTNPVARQS